MNPVTGSDATSPPGRQRVLVLGSTGSIGTQALEVIAANPDRFEVVGLAAGGGNPQLLARQRAQTGVANVAVADPAAADAVGDVAYTGPDAVTRLVQNTEADVVLNALVGALGLKPTLAALASGARLALANKESLVAGGPLVVKAAAPGQIVPVDSEHSALAQCLRGGTADEVAKLVLTASGGPFRGWTAAQLEDVTPEQAGAHPTWSMGPMNTLNSASLVNKGLELIETHLLFGVPYERIEVVVHPQSIVHSMVTFTDGSTLAQASPPDMRLPIALALGWPSRVAGAAPACDFSTASTWEFEPLDDDGLPGGRAGAPGRNRRRVPDRRLQRGQRGSGGGVPRRAHRVFRRSCAPSSRCCALPTSGRPNQLPWKTYSTRRTGPGTGRGARSSTNSQVPGTSRGRGQQMMFAIGIVLFALAILLSVALHECGHMWVARATGMKVRRYFVGFGPTLWSTRRPNRLGSTEYGVKAVPLGGFCDIAGMTSVEELEPDERPYAMYRQKAWKRVAVLAAGPGMNFIIGLVLIYGIALVWGLPNLHQPTNAMVGETACVKAEVTQGELGDCVVPSPAAAAGIRAGDVVVKVGDTPVADFDEMVSAVRKLNGPTVLTVQRDEDGQTREFTTTVDVTPSQRFVAGTDGAAPAPANVGTIGVTAASFGPTQYNPLSAVPATFAFTGDLTVELGKSLAKIPTKVGALVHSIGGGERDPETPISVVGASIIGGDTVEPACGWRSGSSWRS